MQYIAIHKCAPETCVVSGLGGSVHSVLFASLADKSPSQLTKVDYGSLRVVPKLEYSLFGITVCCYI